MRQRRGNVKLAFITERAKRKETYKKAKRSLLKELDELTTLCGVEACAVISSEFESKPKFWPSREGVEHVFARFEQMSQGERSIAKVEESIENLRKKTREEEMTTLMWESLTGKSGLDNLTVQDLSDLGQVIDRTLESIVKRIEVLEQNGADPVVTGTDDAGALAGGRGPTDLKAN